MRHVPVYVVGGSREMESGIVGVDLDAVQPVIEEAESDYWRDDGGPATYLYLAPRRDDLPDEFVVVGLSVADACAMVRGELAPPLRAPWYDLRATAVQS